MVENVENDKKPTLGFSVSGAPIWLCKELSNEAKQYYNNVYWPVIVGWYRKAKELDNLMRGGVPEMEEPKESIEIEEKEDNGVSLFGGHKGE